MSRQELSGNLIIILDVLLHCFILLQLLDGHIGDFHLELCWTRSFCHSSEWGKKFTNESIEKLYYCKAVYSK